MSSTNVNLLSPAAGVSFQAGEFPKRIRLMAIIALGVFLVASIVTLGTFFYFRGQLTKSQQDERSLLAGIGALTQVETLNDVVTSRMSILWRITTKERDWKKFLGLIDSIISADHVASYSIDEAGSVAVKLVPLTISEAAGVVAKLTSLTKSHQIVQARFDSMNLDPTGNIVLTMSFVSL